MKPDAGNTDYRARFNCACGYYSEIKVDDNGVSFWGGFKFDLHLLPAPEYPKGGNYPDEPQVLKAE